MSFRVSVEVAGKPEIDRAFQNILALTDDFQPVIDEVAGEFYRIEEDQFNSEGAAGGSPWVALTPEYAQWKAERFPFRQIEERTGALRDSLTKKGAPGNIDRRTKDTLEIGSNIRHARAQHAGVPGRNLPSRRLISLEGDNTLRIQKAAQRGVVKGLKLGLLVRTNE